MDEGSTEGVGGQTAASYLRGAGTLSSLASDCAVLDDTSPFISDKEKTSPLRHATCNGERATGFPRSCVVVRLNPSATSPDAAVT